MDRAVFHHVTAYSALDKSRIPYLNFFIYHRKKEEYNFQVMVFWVMTLCSDVVGYQCFSGPCCLCLQGEVNGCRIGYIATDGSMRVARVHCGPVGSRED
jgi:hypothetical protein